MTSLLRRVVGLGIGLLPMAPLARADTRDLRVEGKKPAEFVAERTGQSWAVVIGIDEYEKAPKLKYAVADAQAVGLALAARGFQVTSLYDEQATRDNILGALGDKLVERVGEQDRVVIFFSGHGETKKAKGGRTTGYLVPVAGDADALAETAISMSMIRDLSEALPAKHVLFLVDTCYGGIAGTLGKSIPQMTESYLREITRERGRQLITAGGPDQRALEGPEWGHSVFTYYLLEGLEKGLADLNEDGIIPASELYAYLDSRVFRAANLKGHQQRPERWDLAAEKGEFVFFTTARASAGGLAPAEAPRRQAPVPGPSAARPTEPDKKVSSNKIHAKQLPIDPAVVGTWQLHLPVNQKIARLVLVVKDDASYNFTSDNPTMAPHSGRFETKEGLWFMQSPTWSDAGTYHLPNPNTLVLHGKFGPGAWARMRE